VPSYPCLAVALRLPLCRPGPSGGAAILAQFNSDVPWYFGVDGAVPQDQYDFATVMLHEMHHGLGFSGQLEWDGTRLEVFNAGSSVRFQRGLASPLRRPSSVPASRW
jgi:hypothetical protein